MQEKPSSAAKAKISSNESSPRMAETKPSCMRHAPFLVDQLDGYPAILAMTPQNRLAQHDLAMAVLECRERPRAGPVASVDVVIDGPEQLFECIRESFVVPAGIAGEPPRFRAEQRRVTHEQLVGSVAMPDPHLVRVFAGPRHCTATAGDLEADAVFASRGHLGHSQATGRSALEAKQD